jgi:AcrR family transcriptional regulator
MPRTGLTPQQVREKAIASAEKKIRLLGFDKFRLVDIAKDLGVAHASLYNHFSDKAALLDAVTEKWIKMVDTRLGAIAARKQSPLKVIVDWFLTLHRMKREKILQDPELYKAFNMAAESKKPFIAAHLKNLHDLLLGLVKAAIDAGEIDKNPPEKITQILFDATRGFVHPKLVLEFLEEDREPALKSILRMVFKGLSHSTGSNNPFTYRPTRMK